MGQDYTLVATSLFFRFRSKSNRLLQDQTIWHRSFDLHTAWLAISSLFLFQTSFTYLVIDITERWQQQTKWAGKLHTCFALLSNLTHGDVGKWHLKPYRIQASCQSIIVNVPNVGHTLQCLPKLLMKELWSWICTKVKYSKIVSQFNMSWKCWDSFACLPRLTLTGEIHLLNLS
jgi:hypothetical protein